jgi:hypothetical protein
VAVEEEGVECVLLMAIANAPCRLIGLPLAEALALAEGWPLGVGWVLGAMLRQQALALASVAQGDWRAWRDPLLDHRAAEVCLS